MRLTSSKAEVQMCVKPTCTDPVWLCVSLAYSETEVLMCMKPTCTDPVQPLLASYPLILKH
jgi:hypothetical protein